MNVEDALREEVERLERLCRRWRESGLTGSWTYSLPQHWADFRRYKKLKATLEVLK